MSVRFGIVARLRSFSAVTTVVVTPDHIVLGDLTDLLQGDSVGLFLTV